MHPQKLARAFCDAIGKSGHELDETDIADAHDLIQTHGFSESGALVAEVVKRIRETSPPVTTLTQAIPYFTQAALVVTESARAKERNRRAQQQRREEDAQASAEKERHMAALTALPVNKRRKLIEAQRTEHPFAPESWRVQLAAKEAALLSQRE